MSGWQPIRRGAYLDWRRPDPLRATDPYLVWADGTGFEPYGGPPRGGRLPTLIELSPGATVQDLLAASRGSLSSRDIPAPYRQGGDDRFLTAWPSARFFQELHGSLTGVVRRAEISLPVIPERPRFKPLVPPTCAGAVDRGIAARRLVGVIDDGSAFAQAHLRDGAGRTRIRRLWDQDPQGAFARQGTVPADFGRGREVDGATLDALIDRFSRDGAIHEDALYEAAGYEQLRRSATHGTHVTDVAAGTFSVGSRVGTATAPPPWQAAGDAASADDTGIVFVQLPRACLQDPSGGWLDVHLLDAAMYILSCAGPQTEQVVINISFGPQRGPNDGSAMLEEALAALSRRHSRLTIALSAGNSFRSRGHASMTFGASGECGPLHWQVMPGDETPSFLQVWLPDGAADVQAQLTPPGAAPGPWLAPGSAEVWPCASAPACGVVYPPTTARGAHGTLILVALAPTASFRPGAALAPHGTWQLKLRGGTAGAQAWAWIDRDDFNLGTMVRGRQSRFVARPPGSEGAPARDSATAGPGVVVSGRGTLNGIGTGPGTLLVAGYRISDRAHAPYSSAGPARTEGTILDCAAPTDQSRTLPGLLAAGTRGASVRRLIGTSVAAPQLARWVIDGRPPPGPQPHRPHDPQWQGRGLLPLA